MPSEDDKIKYAVSYPVVLEEFVPGDPRLSELSAHAKALGLQLNIILTPPDEGLQRMKK